MTQIRPEDLASLYTHDTIYLPPHAEGSIPLEVSLGCSWHKCTFCDFAKDPFHVHSLERIEGNLKLLSSYYPDNPYMFFLGENAFCLPAQKLLEIMSLVSEHLPKVCYFSMYSRIDDILKKSDLELELLRKCGLYSLHIGLESGSDSILAERKKGITAAEALYACRRLEKAGIDYYLTIILGLGGKPFSRMHALETASLLNKLHPKNIWCLKLKLWEDTPLYKEAKTGAFEMMTDAEMLWEERILLDSLTVTDCLFEDTTVLNQYTIRGMLPSQKAELLNAIDYLLTTVPRNDRM